MHLDQSLKHGQFPNKVALSLLRLRSFDAMASGNLKANVLPSDRQALLIGRCLLEAVMAGPEPRSRHSNVLLPPPVFEMGKIEAQS